MTTTRDPDNGTGAFGKPGKAVMPSTVSRQNKQVQTGKSERENVEWNGMICLVEDVGFVLVRPVQCAHH
jgi:hypothetical protein